MVAEIFAKSGGARSVVAQDAIKVDVPSVIRLQLSRADVQAMARDGNDLVVTLKDGQTIRIPDFYTMGVEESSHDLVLQETDGSMWLARPGQGAPFFEVAEWDELVTSSLAASDDGSGGGAILPIIGGLAGLGIAAAAASGGDGNDNKPVPDTTPPAAPTAALLNDNGESNSDQITNDGRVGVTGVEPGAQIQYRINGGEWIDATSPIDLPEGVHVDVEVRQIDAADNVGPAFELGTIIVDKTPPGPVAAEFDEPVAGGITNDAVVNVTVDDIEDGATVEYLDEAGVWTEVEVIDGTIAIPDGTYEPLQIRQVDLAGNSSEPTALGNVIVDTEAPAALTGELAEDTGPFDDDGITNNGRIDVTGDEDGATIQYLNEAGVWTTVALVEGSFVAPAGIYEDFQIRQIDAAGNEGDPVSLGPITIDLSPPPPITAEFAVDVGEDGTTNDAVVTVDGVESGATVEYLNEDGVWTEVEVVDDSITIPDGEYEPLQVRQVDLAGNPSGPTELGDVIIDGPPGLLVAELAEDTGALDDDGITSNGQIDVTGVEDGATVQYLNEAGVWTAVALVDDSFTAPEGVYEDFQVRQIDTAGNEGDPASLGPITIDMTNPAPVAAELAEDVGEDGATNDALVNVTVADIEDGATVEYLNEDGVWTEVDVVDGSITIPDGEYEPLQVRQVDLAGNESTSTDLGNVIVDTLPPPIPALALELDTGASASDFVTQNGTVNVGGIDPGATVEYRIDGGAWTPVTDGSFTLGLGEYQNVEVRQTDIAGNIGPVNIIPTLVVDTAVAVPVAGLIADTGDNDGDGVTANGIVEVTEFEDGAILEYRVDGGTWTLITGDSFTLPLGVNADVEVRQTDLAGNISDPAELGTIEVVAALDALDDDITLAMGEATSTVTGPVTTEDFQVLELLDGETGPEAGVPFTVDDDQSGALHVEVMQTSLVAVADAFAIDVYTADGALVARAVSAGSPLVGDGAGLAILGVTGDNILTADFTGLPPGEYYVVVSNDSSTLDALVQGLTLEDLGQGDAVLGAENQEVILDAVYDALGGDSNMLAGGIVTALGLALTPLNNTPLTEVLDDLTGLLSAAGVTGPVDDILDAVSSALLSNAAAIFETTTIETTLVEYDFANETTGGNVFADNGAGADVISGDAEVISVRNADGVEVELTGPGPFMIAGEYGVLTISPDGVFSYASNGDLSSLGETDSFSYTIDNGISQDSATLNFAISGEGVEAGTIVAVDDSAALNMGAISAETSTPVTVSDVSVLSLLDSSEGFDSATMVTVGPDSSGTLRIEVEQTALVAVGDAFRLEVYDSDGNLVYTGVTQNSLVGAVGEASLLAVVGDDGLVANVTGLPPGDYYVVVANDQGALDTIVQGLELADLGQDDAVLGAQNQAIILEALGDALGDNALSNTAVTAVGLVLNTLNGTPLPAVLQAVDTALSIIPGLTGQVDDLLDDISTALLSNAATIFQQTNITTTLTEYDFVDELVTGNVILGDAGVGADDIGMGAKVRSVTNADGETMAVTAGAETRIAGEYGVLTISATGAYSYQAYGDPASVGQTETFSYEIGILGANDTAELTIEIGGTPVSVTDDSADAGTQWAYAVSDAFFNASGTVTTALGIPGSYTSANIVVDPNEQLTGSVQVNVTIAAVASGDVVIQQLVDGDWQDVAGTEQSLDMVLGLVGNIATIDLSEYALGAGTYRVSATLAGVAASASVVSDIDALLLDQPELVSSTNATGNIFENDILGSLDTSLQVRADGEAIFIDVEAAQQIVGDYGTLTINPDGSYSYAVREDLEFTNTILTDMFDYILTHPSDVQATGELEITITPSGDGVTTVEILGTNDLSALLDNFLGAEEFAANDNSAATVPPAPIEPLVMDPIDNMLQDDPLYMSVV